ncbi:MAG: hypothetical protein JWP59_4172 [Massilia sp.]|nr:hypothetical protein [Massilia sp.]
MKYLTLLVMLSGAGHGASAQTLAERAIGFDVACCSAPSGWRKIAPQALDQQRGGFDLPSGLTMSLGIERLVSINGQLVAQSSFNVANIASISADEARQARDAIGGARLVQNGAGNFAGLPSVPGTYVQNTLNGQTIGTQTVINANVNSASLMTNLNFNGAVRDAGIRAIPVH